MHAVAEMASGIAHDFNNMLTSVVGFISLAKMNLKVGRPAIQELEKAEKIALRSSELSETLITFSRGNKPIKKKVSIAAFLNRSLNLTLSGSNIKFEFSSTDFETDFAACGEEAVQKYQEAMKSDYGFDAVILDLTIKGGMGGEEALEKLLDIDPDVVAFVSSAYAGDAVMVNYRKHGFRGVIAKPYNIDELGKEISIITR